MPVDVEITRPAWLLALPVLAAALVLVRLPWWQTAAPRAEARRLAVRMAWLALPVLALAGFTLTRPLDRLAAIFVVDHSASVAAVRDIQDAAVRAALAALEDPDHAAIVATGAAATVIQPLASGALFDGVALSADGASDLAGGIALAAGLAPADRTGRIVLLSDGRETAGDAVAVAGELAARGLTVDVLPLGADAVADVRLDRVETPEIARERESTVLRAAVAAGRPTTAAIRVYRDDALIVERRTELRGGEHELAFPLPPAEPGMHRLRVVVDADDGAADATPLNNTLGAVQRVLGAPSVMIIAAEPSHAGFLPRALRAGGAEVRLATPAAVPADLAGMAAYDAIVIADVPADARRPARCRCSSATSASSAAAS